MTQGQVPPEAATFTEQNIGAQRLLINATSSFHDWLAYMPLAIYVVFWSLSPCSSRWPPLLRIIFIAVTISTHNMDQIPAKHSVCIYQFIYSDS